MIGLYIHIPFCEKKCYYCDFISYEKSEYLMNSYIDALICEINLIKERKFNTIFIGGGTPTYLDEKNLSRLLKTLEKFSSGCEEFTIESNPGTLNKEKLSIMKEYGVNRLSIGLQSANERTLEFIGRTHSFKDFDKSFNDARNMGFENINVDIIFAIPNESIDLYDKTLTRISEYNLNHISAYNLILEENTKFYQMYKNNEFEELDEDLQYKSYIYTKNFLQNIGFNQYEVSNYSKNGKECLHNLSCWNFDDYIGVGVSAHSFYKGKRLEHTKIIHEYIRSSNKEKINYKKIYRNKLEDSIFEYIMLGFRKKKGIEFSDFENRFGKKFMDIFFDQVKKYTGNNMIFIDENNIYLTDKGFLVMNYILKDFL